MFETTREEVRQIYFDVWQKHQNKELLEPQEQRILNTLLAHPEYHFIFKNPEATLEKDYFSELGQANPFLHMGLHLAIGDQLSLDQPLGIRKLFKQAVERFGDTHEAEHCIAASLANELYNLQSSNKLFDQQQYLKNIKKAIKKGKW